MTKIERLLKERLTPQEMGLLSDWVLSDILATENSVNTPSVKKEWIAETNALANKLCGGYIDARKSGTVNDYFLSKK